MSYLHIENLYRSRDILLFKQCYAMEKIHGTSAHILWRPAVPDMLILFSGGEKHARFAALFDEAGLRAYFAASASARAVEDDIVIYGEAYGGSQQGMSKTYGDKLRFVAFDVQIDGHWLSVPDAERFVTAAGLEFVPYVEIETTPEALDTARAADSVQAVKNGMGPGHKREGIVLRPLIEVTKNNGERIIAKHKNDEFKETATARPLDVEKLKVLTAAAAIAEEWVTATRLTHVLDKLPQPHGVRDTPAVISAMLEDVLREGKDEIKIDDAHALRAAIGRRTVQLFKAQLTEGEP